MNRDHIIDALKRYQAANGLSNVHLVSIDPDGFAIAHTDEERAADAPLYECPLHEALLDQGGPPVKVGVYMATRHEADGYSESYRGDALGWDFVAEITAAFDEEFGAEARTPVEG